CSTNPEVGPDARTWDTRVRTSSCLRLTRVTHVKNGQWVDDDRTAPTGQRDWRFLAAAIRPRSLWSRTTLRIRTASGVTSTQSYHEACGPGLRHGYARLLRSPRRTRPHDRTPRPVLELACAAAAGSRAPDRWPTVCW